MLIVSKFHDYYDTALAHGVDKTCVYNRTTEKTPGTKEDESGLESLAWCKRGENPWRSRECEFLFQCIVGFAGNLYPMMYHALSKGAGWDKAFMYDSQSCMKFLDEHFPETREHDNAKKYRWTWKLDMSDVAIEEFYQPEKYKRLERIFMEKKVPAFVVRRKRRGVVIETNPVLKQYSFMKVKDAYTAMQEIHMYLAGVIGMADRDTAEVGNDDRIKQRGFDKYSFRKDPTKRKPK